MSFTVNRKALESELALLQVVAEKKSTIPVLSTVRIVMAEGLARLTATDLDMSLSTQVPAAGESWAGCVPSKQLYELARLLTGDNVEIEAKDNERVQVKCGRSKHLLPTFPVTQFPALEQPDIATVTLSGKVLSTAIARAVGCITTDAVEHWMQGMAMRSHGNSLHIAATNSRHLAVTEIPAELKIDVLLPARAAAALVKLLTEGNVEFGASSNHAVFKQGGRTFTARLFSASFPDWRPLLPTEFKHSVTLEPEPARQAFRLASVTARETALIPIPLRLTLSSHEMVIETTESERGQSSEVLAIDCPTINGDSFSKGVNGQHFINFLDSEAKAVMAFNDDLRIIQLSYEGEPDYRYITMALKA